MAEPTPTTILLFDLPALLEDILADALGDRPDFRVVRSSGDAEGPMAGARRDGAMVVVVAGEDAADLTAIDPRMSQTAAISMLAFGNGGARACVHTVQTRAAAVDDVSIAQVMAILTSIADRKSA